MFAQSKSADDIKAAVTRMARGGRCSFPAFSPDGKTLAVICDMSGLPQIWTVPIEGDWPTLITAFDDPAGGGELVAELRLACVIGHKRRVGFITAERWRI